MHEFQAKNKIKRILYSKYTVFALVLAAVIMARSVIDVYLKEKDSAQKVASAQTVLSKLEEREKILGGEIESLKTQEGLESEIRANYDVVKPGEKVLIIVDNDKPTTTVEKKEKGFWSWVFGW